MTCLSKSSAAVGIFASINDTFERNSVPWESCVSLGVDNTSVNVGKHNSLLVEAKKLNPHIMLMGCPCHVVHNTAGKATDAFEAYVTDFDVKELLVHVYFHFDYSSKGKNLLVDFCQFCDQEPHKIIKFHSVCWLGLSTCIERILKMFPWLNRLIKAFENPLTEVNDPYDVRLQ